MDRAAALARRFDRPVRWSEIRNPGPAAELHQTGTFAPADGENRWMPSVAMNAAGDIGIGYLVWSTSTYVSTAAAGHSPEGS